MDISALPSSDQFEGHVHTYNLLPLTSLYFPVKHRFTALGPLSVGWMASSRNYRRYFRDLDYQKLLKEGYVFRKTPVSGTGYYSNRYRRSGRSGLKEEVRNDYTCTSEYPEFNLVRAKRSKYVRLAYNWDCEYYDGPGKSRPRRSWKRTHKLKQYM